MNRLEQIREFYNVLSELNAKLGAPRRFKDCHGRMKWPSYGVYFVYEDGENRSDSGDGQRVVRIGTHALTAVSKTTLWTRMRQHRGNKNNGGGNHRGSIFRLHVGTALISSGLEGLAANTWGVGETADAQTRAREHDLERRVSEVIGSMRVQWLAIDDRHLRGFIERNAIALLSNYHLQNHAIDQSSSRWIGRSCANPKVQRSGLWNVKHTEEDYDSGFLVQLSKLVNAL